MVRDHSDDPAFAGLPLKRNENLLSRFSRAFLLNLRQWKLGLVRPLPTITITALIISTNSTWLVNRNRINSRFGAMAARARATPSIMQEVVAALAALNFFSRAGTGNPESYVIGTSTHDLNSEKISLRHLPRYTAGEDEIEPEAAFLASAVMHHLVINQVPWDIPARGSPKNFEACGRSTRTTRVASSTIGRNSMERPTSSRSTWTPR